MDTAAYNNRLLQLMNHDDLAALGALERIVLPMKQRIDGLEDGGSVYFIESGVASIIADVDGKMAVELGIVGPEGMLGLATVYGDSVDPFQTVMQVEGG